MDILENRKVMKYTWKVMLMRILWNIGEIPFRYSFRTMFGFRSSLLRIFGARVGEHVHIYNTAVIYMPWNLEIGDYSAIGEYAFIYNLAPIKIGSCATISQRAHLCAGTHDYTNPALPLLKLPVLIGDQTWICADAFVGPGVTVAEGAIVGARGVVVKDVGEWDIVAGNPAKFIKKRILKK